MASNYEAICEENQRRYGTEGAQKSGELAADLYDDRTHFIFELLQNAEDALGRRGDWQGPRKVAFALASTRLTLSHFGKPFDEADVRSVCDIAESTKNESSIGRFGLGFKSVYTVTDLPSIHSGDEDFAIEDYVFPKRADRKQNESPNRPVEKITLVCMGHEPDLAAQLQLNARPFKVDVEVVDILRDKANLEFKRDSQGKVSIKRGDLIVEKFYPMNLLQKLSLQKDAVDDWKELVESVLIDWNYDGAVLQPAVVDIPGKDELVKGVYKVPDDAGTIRVKITDLLSESWEGSVNNGD